ncbi:hypothetical protein ACLB2K_016883 [Fragaria x ananassa]
MDKSWMFEDRRSQAYELGVEGFLKFAAENATNENNIPCPCWDCGNTKDFGIGIIKGHLFSYGITPTYQNWIWHGEPSKSASNLDSHVDSTLKCGPRNTHEVEADREDDHEPMIDIDSGYMDGNAYDDSGIHRNEFTDFFENADQPLFPGCQNFTNLSALLECYKLKGQSGISDTCFTLMLIMIGKFLPEGHGIPSTKHQAKKALTVLCMDYEKIHACRNDCILYRGDYKNATTCPTCGILRYKLGKDNIVKEGVRPCQGVVVLFTHSQISKDVRNQ